MFSYGSLGIPLHHSNPCPKSGLSARAAERLSRWMEQRNSKGDGGKKKKSCLCLKFQSCKGKAEKGAFLQGSAFSLRPLSAGKCLKIFGEILALRAGASAALLMSTLPMFAGKACWDEGERGGRLQSFPCLQTTTEAEAGFPEGILPQSIAPA